jgi:alcohol dehydrogenase (cytochrome c)
MRPSLLALDAGIGAPLRGHDVRGAVAGGLISYESGGKQRLAVAAGLTSPIRPTEKATAQIVVPSMT